MSLVAAIRQMLDDGLTVEQALLAAEAVERTMTLVNLKPRSANAERQARWRERNKPSHCVTNNVTVTGETEITEIVTSPTEPREPALVVQTSLDSKQEPKERTPPKGGVPKKGYRETGAALPEDWHPSDDLLAYGKRLGLTDVQSRDILENMRLWARANRNRSIARKADWDQTAQGFLRRDAAKFQARAGPAIPPQNDRRVYLGVDQQKQLLDEYYDRIEGKSREPAFKLIR